MISVSSYDAKPAKRGLICPDLVACFVDPCQVWQMFNLDFF